MGLNQYVHAGDPIGLRPNMHLHLRCHQTLGVRTSVVALLAGFGSIAANAA